MDNIFINEPGLREFRVIMMQERNFKGDRMHLRLCIRNYNMIRSLSGFMSNSKLFRISRFYKTKSEYSSFKLIHNLENRIKYQTLCRFKIRSENILLESFSNEKNFLLDLGTIMTRKRTHNYIFYTSSLFSYLDSRIEENDSLTASKTENNSSLDTNIKCTPTVQPIEKFFTDSFSDISDQTERFDGKTSPKKLCDLFFTGDLFFSEIGDKDSFLTEQEKDKMEDKRSKRNTRKITINLKLREGHGERKTALCREDKIIFANESKNEMVKTKEMSILDQHPNEIMPKRVDLNSFISENNDQINFDFKKITVSKKSSMSRILGEKDVNRQRVIQETKDYESILKKNTVLNSNYKFIKVYHTNISPKKAPVSSEKRKRLVKFAESCDDEPHNTTEIKPILQKSKNIKRLKSAKTKQTVFIKRLG